MVLYEEHFSISKKMKHFFRKNFLTLLIIANLFMGYLCAGFLFYDDIKNNQDKEKSKEIALDVCSVFTKQIDYSECIDFFNYMIYESTNDEVISQIAVSYLLVKTEIFKNEKYFFHLTNKE